MINKMLKKLNFIKIIILVLGLIIIQLLTHYIGYVIVNKANIGIELNSMPYYVYKYGFNFVCLIVLVSVVFSLKTSTKANKGIIKIGLKNSSNEYPRIKNKFKDEAKENRYIYEVETRNIPLAEFKANQSELETVFNIKIDYMEYKPRTTKYVYIYGTPRKNLKPKLFEYSDNDFLTMGTKNELIMGKTRSGKTVYAKIKLANMCRQFTNRHNKVELYISDFKNEDFIDLSDTKNYFGYLDAVNGINKVHSIMLDRIENNIDKKDRSIIILLIDEYSTLLSELPKKEAEELQKKVGALLRSGASKDIIPIIIDQEAYSNTFPNAKHQFRTLVCFGNLDETQKDMLLKEYKSQITEINKTGEAYVFQDGLEDLTRIKVIYRENENKSLIDDIRPHMS